MVQPTSNSAATNALALQSTLSHNAPAGTSRTTDDLPAGPVHLTLLGVGTQGKAYAAQALHGNVSDLVIRTRQPDGFRRKDTVSYTNRFTKTPESVKLSGDARVLIVKDLPAHELPDGSRHLYINSAPSWARDANLAGLPAGADVLLAQNGLAAMPSSAEDTASYEFCVSMIGSSNDADGVKVAPNGSLLIGEKGRLTPLVQQSLSAGPVFEVKTVADIQKAKWEKAALNCALNATATLFGETYRQVGADPATARLARAIAAEVCAVAHARGVAVDATAVQNNMEKVYATMGGHRSSMQASFTAGEPLELDSLNGAIGRLAKEALPPLNQTGSQPDHRVPTPLNDAISEALRRQVDVRDQGGNAGTFYADRASEVAEEKAKIVALSERLANTQPQAAVA